MMRGHDFKVIDPKDIPEKLTGGRVSRYAVTLGEFMRSGAPAVEMTDVSCVTSATSCLTKAIAAAGLQSHVQCYRRQGRVFLVRVEQ